MQNSSFNVKDTRNLSILTDFYEFTMANGFFESEVKDVIGVYDIFYRKIPDNGGFSLFCGLEQAIEYLENLKFTQNDIDYLKSKNLFSDKFLEYLKNFNFCCNVWSFAEGTPVFPKEPMMIVEGPIIQAQLLETALLIFINHQTLIATKANRIVRSANGKPVQEFGARRAQGVDAANYGTRACYVAGCVSSSNTMAERDMGIAASGTMAHSWVQMFENEYQAFKTYAEIYPDTTVLLVDTYNVLKSGVPNAIRVFDEVLKPLGKRPIGIRIDSGDIAVLSKKSRQMLDNAGYQDVKIIVSNSLDEYIITDLLKNNAEIDSFGVGESMITSKTTPLLGGVYKLVAIKNSDGTYTPKIKISASVEKTTMPYLKQVYRIFSKETGKALCDYIAVYDETVKDLDSITVFFNDEKQKTYHNICIKPLLLQIFKDGKRVYTSPSLDSIRDYAKQQVELLPTSIKSLISASGYNIACSDYILAEQKRMLKQYK